MKKSLLSVMAIGAVTTALTLPLHQVQAEPLGDNLQQKLSLRTKLQAKSVAEAFIAKRAGKYAQWKSSRIAEIVALTNHKGQIQGYEVQIQDDSKQAAGYLIVEAQNTKIGVAEYSAKGFSPTQRLVQDFEAKTMQNLQPESKVQFLWNGPGTAGLLWQNDYSEQQLLTLNPSQTMADYATDRQFNVKAKIQNKVQHQLANHAVADAVIDWSFKPFYQEYRTWQNSTSSRNTCYAGCTPVAAAMLIDFYDRNGYPNMIGNEYQQDHYASSALMRATIDNLRGVMGTQCRSDGQGGTSQSGSAKLVDYMNQRGEGVWSARRISYSTMSTFLYMVKEINAKRPALVHYHTRGSIGSNHSAIAYGYEYGGFWSDNFLTVRTGWSRDEEINYNIESMGTLSTTIVSRD